VIIKGALGPSCLFLMGGELHQPKRIETNFALCLLN
jgi:hypothetical protein